MKKETKRDFSLAAVLLAAFILWTVSVKIVDVRAIGPMGSWVGFASINGFVRSLVGVNMSLYTVTDWLGIVPLLFVMGFATLGLVQLIGRRSILKVDRSILALGGFYILVLSAFVFFEIYVVNYRPVLIDGRLEASYPSSTTMLSMCVMPTAAIQLKARIHNVAVRRCVCFAICLFVLFMVIGRLISGVHWFTDIIGGALLSSSLVFLYSAVIRWLLSR